MKDRLLRLVRAATVCLLASWPARALAEEPGRLPLEWSAEEDCPDRAAAETSILEILGRRGSAEGDTDSARVEITHLPSGRWQARITTRGDSGSGQRRLEGASCDRVAEAAILIVAMTLDAVKVAQEVKTTRAVAKRSVQVPPASADHPRPLLGVRVPGDLGSLPGPTLGLGLLFGLETGQVRVEAEGTLWAPSVAFAGPTAGTGGEIGLYTAGIRGCFDAVTGSGEGIRFGPCVGAEAGVTTGASLGLEPATHRRGTWVAVLAGMSFRQVASSGLSYGLSADLGAPLRRPAFVIDNFGTVFQASSVIVRASLTLAWIFP